MSYKTYPDDLVEDAKILKARGLTMGEVAKRLNVSERTLYRILKEA